MDLDLDGVDVTAAGSRLLHELSLHAAHGSVVGLVGPNGSGKSTTLRCVYGALAPQAGRVLLDGVDLARHSRPQLAQQMAVLLQDHHVEFDFTVAEIVAMGRLPHRTGLGGQTPADRQACHAALDQVGMTVMAQRSFLTLSGGERQRVLIARALAQQPRLLVLDEPTNHLDVRHQLEVLAMARRACLQRGLTVLTALHDLNLASNHCDEIYVLDHGEVVAAGPPEAVITERLALETFGVSAHRFTHPRTGAPQLVFDQAVKE